MMASQNADCARIESLLTPLLTNRTFRSPAGPTAKTVPTMISRTTEKTRMTFFMTGPRYVPVTSEIEAPLFLSESMPEK